MTEVGGMSDAKALKWPGVRSALVFLMSLRREGRVLAEDDDGIYNIHGIQTRERYRQDAV